MTLSLYPSQQRLTHTSRQLFLVRSLAPSPESQQQQKYATQTVEIMKYSLFEPSETCAVSPVQSQVLLYLTRRPLCHSFITPSHQLEFLIFFF